MFLDSRSDRVYLAVMQIASVESSFGLENLAIREGEIPTPGPDQVLVRVRAASLNYRDLLVVTGRYNPSFPLPLTVGSDAVGEIAALGEHASSTLAIGDRVCPLFCQGWLGGPPLRTTARQALGGPLPGVFAEYALARADSVVKVPAFLSDVEAACLPCAALTAWSALVTLSPLQKGDRLLTLGTGGVSVFAIQIARARGATVFGTTRDLGKRERLERLGVDAIIDAKAPKWGDAVRRLAGGEGVDQVIELGGASTLGESLRAVRPGGTISLIGVLGGTEQPPSLLPVVMRNVRIQGVFVGHRESFEALLVFCIENAIHPVIDVVFPFERIREAFDYLQAGTHVGKVCLQMAV